MNAGVGEERAGASVVQLPRRKRKGLRAWIAAGVALLVVAAIVVLLYLTPVLSVRTIQVTGARLADPAKVEALLKPLIGTPLARVSDQAVMDRLKGEPAISEIRLGLEGPTGLVVNVVEHREVAVLQQGKSFLLVGDNGARLKTLSKRTDRELPLVKLESSDPDGKIFDTVIHALAQLPPAVLKQLETAQAGTIDTVEFSLSGGRTVVWGDASQGALKAQVLAAMLKDSKIKDKTIDVSTPTTPLSK